MARLSADFDDVEVEHGLHTWQFASLHTAHHFVTQESPMHVSVLATSTRRGAAS
jgi:hypothetical protein